MGSAAGFIFLHYHPVFAVNIGSTSRWKNNMSAKSIFVFLLVVGAIVWFAMKDNHAPPSKAQTLITPAQQKLMGKASNLDKEMQKSLDQRMNSDPSAQ